MLTVVKPVVLVQVENELRQTVHEPDNTLVLYMQELNDAFREAGIVVPLTHNEKGMYEQSWSTDFEDVGGSVDMYALDHYPGALSCTNNDTGFAVNREYYQWFQKTSWTQPEYLAEFEGGWFSAWGADVFYDECYTEHSPEFADVYYKNNIGQRVTLLGIYMTYGGTNWGHCKLVFCQSRKCAKLTVQPLLRLFTLATTTGQSLSSPLA